MNRPSRSREGLLLSDQRVLQSGREDPTQGTALLQFQQHPVHPRHTGIKSLAFAHDGRLLAVAEESNNVSLYDCGKHRVIAVCDGSDAGVSDISFAPANGVLLITPNRVFAPLRLWNLQTQELVVESSDTTYVRRMAISPDGASISRFGPGPDFLSFARWESESATRTAAIWEAHEDSLADLAFSQPDGRYVASSAGDEIKIWKMEE